MFRCGRIRGDRGRGLWSWSARRIQSIRVEQGQKIRKPIPIFFQPGSGPDRDINRNILLGWVCFGNQEKSGLFPTPTWKMNQTMPIQVDKKGDSPGSLADEIPKMCLLLDERIHEANEYVSMKDKVIVYNLASAINNLYEPMQTEEACSENDSDYPELVLELGYKDNEKIEEFIDLMTTVAKVLIKHEGIVQILEDFLQTLAPGSECTIINRALQHFGKVKNVLGNQHLVGVLRTVVYEFPSVNACVGVSRWRRSEFIMRMMKSESSFEDILKYQDQATMMRNGLSILIGYWSNEDMIGRLLSIGGSSLLTLLKGEEDILACGEKEMCTESLTPIKVMSFYTPIEDLCQDSSIEELANQLLKIPKAVKLVKEFLISLQDNGTAGTREKNINQYNAAKRFWSEPLIIMELIRALNQSTILVDVFRQYSKTAQVIRCVENMTRIQSDPLFDSIFLSDDPFRKMRGILSILFGYSWEADVCEFFECIYKSGFGIKEDDDVQVFKYLAYGPGDVEGLKNVLAEKYSKDSEKYMDLFDKISKYPEMKKQQKVSKRMFKEKKEKADLEVVYELALIRVILRNDQLILYDVECLL